MSLGIYTDLKTQVIDSLKSLQTEGFLPEKMCYDNVVVEQPKDISHGDFATNAAMVLSKQARKNPREIAERLAGSLEGKAGIVKAEVAGPGFLNFRMDKEQFHNQVNLILEKSVAYGASEQGVGHKVMVEYVSINPTGPIHVGHGRNAVYGDSLANLLEKAGYNVWREYYLNDAGGQIHTIIQSVHLRYRELFGEEITLPDGCYPGDYVIDIAQTLKDKDGDKWLAVTDKQELFDGLRVFCVEACMKLIRADLDVLDIHFDEYFSEYAMHQQDAMGKAVQALRDKDDIYEGTLPPPKGKEVEDYVPEELTLFRSEKYGDDVDRAIYKKNGEATYFGADIAYHNNKLERGFDTLINIWGADHAGAVKRLKSALTSLTGRKDALDIILTQMVRIYKNGEAVKMSKRAGNFVLLKDVLDEVGPDAVRFLMLNRKNDTHFDFDLTKALEKSNDNPVFYVQYAHARICAVYRQQREMGIETVDPKTVDLSLLDKPQEIDLIRLLCLYPLVIDRSAAAHEPHRVAFYASELAGAFHSWYNAEKFLVEEDVPLTQARLALAKATQIILVDSLSVLGVSAPERM